MDIGSQTHYARAFDNRGGELTIKVFVFHNDLEEFNSFNFWTETLKLKIKRQKLWLAVSCKLIRVFYAVLIKGMDYDRFKMMTDIHRNSELIAA